MTDQPTISALPLGTVVKVHALAVFACNRCENHCLRLTVAAVHNGLVGAAETPSGEVLCNDCERKERDSEEAKWKADKKRRAWARKHAALPVKSPFGGDKI